jgi:hypothetical protein
MKKTGVAFLAGAFLAASAFPGPARGAGDAVSTMVAVKGDAVIERNRTERPARVRDGVLLIDTVSTREAARAKMLFVDESVLTLGERSKVVVQEYVFSKEKGGRSIFNLLDGKMKAVVGKAKFEVHTPTAVASARGTVFLVETGVRGGVPYTEVIGLEGEVVVRRKGVAGTVEDTPLGAAPEIVLTPGNHVTVSAGAPLPTPSATPPPLLAALLAATEAVSFEMPLPSVGDLAVPPRDGRRDSSPRDGKGGAALPFGHAAVPPFAQEPAASTATTVGVGATFP